MTQLFILCLLVNSGGLFVYAALALIVILAINALFSR